MHIVYICGNRLMSRKKGVLSNIDVHHKDETRSAIEKILKYHSSNMRCPYYKVHVCKDFDNYLVLFVGFTVSTFVAVFDRCLVDCCD